ncbi:MAG: hypothetical protein ACREOM_13015, partial [Candidatus Dormibacteraceae bacterium]
AVTSIVAALSTRAASRAEVLEAISRTHVQGIAGWIRFDANGDRIDAPVSIWRVVDGRMVAAVERGDR